MQALTGFYVPSLSGHVEVQNLYARIPDDHKIERHCPKGPDSHPPWLLRHNITRHHFRDDGNPLRTREGGVFHPD